MDLFVPLNGAMLQVATNIANREHAEGFAKAWYSGYALAWTLYHHGGPDHAPAPADMSFELRPQDTESTLEVQSFSLKPPVGVTED